MVSQNIVMGIAIGMFIAGLLFGYVAFLGYSGGMTNNQQAMMNNQQAMMQNTLSVQQMMDALAQDPEAMQKWMQNPQHIGQMASLMEQNHDFAMGMMTTMIEDPALRLQMIGHMTDNAESMQQMMTMMESNMVDDMSGNMMDSGMMNQDMMMQMMQDPETREKMIQIMTKHVSEMQDLLSLELTDDEFNTQMMELMQNHMSEMKGLMSSQPMHQPMN